MEQARRLCGQRVFVVAKVRQRGGDEGVQAVQGLGAVQRPAQRGGLRRAKAGHARALYHGPQGAVVVLRAPVGGLRRGAGPGLAVVMVKVPLPAFGLAVGVQHHLVAAAHVAVEVLHQPLAAPVHKSGQVAPGGQEMLAVHRLAGQGLRCCPVPQLGIEPPFVGLLPLHGLGTIVRGQGGQVVRDGLAVAGVVQRHIAHAVAGRAQLARKVAHGGKDGQDFLRVVQHVVSFLAHLHQHIDHLRVHLRKPAVAGVELVAKHQAQGVAGGGHGRLHRSW